MEYGRVTSHQENLRQMETQEVWVVTTGLQDVSRLGSAPRGKMGVWRCPSGGSRNLLPKKAHVLKDAEVVGACILLRGDPHNAGPTTGQTREPQALLEDCGWHKASFRSASPSAPHPLLARCVCPRREDLGTTHIDSGASRRSSLPSFLLMGAFLSASFGVFRMLVCSCPCLGYEKQKENPKDSTPCCFQDP